MGALGGAEEAELKNTKHISQGKVDVSITDSLEAHSTPDLKDMELRVYFPKLRKLTWRHCCEKEFMFLAEHYKFGLKLITYSQISKSGEKATVLCFVEFNDSKCALTAMDALQGYKFDDKKPDTSILRIRFAHFPFHLPAEHVDPRFGSR